MPRRRIGPGVGPPDARPSHNETGSPRTTRPAIRKIEAVGKARRGRQQDAQRRDGNASQTTISVAAHSRFAGTSRNELT